MRTILLLCAFFSLARITAQELPAPAVTDTLPELLRAVRVQYDNDVFHGTDRYYTSGFRGEIFAPFAWKIPVTRVLLTMGRDYDEAYGLSVNQRCFTPGTRYGDSVQQSGRPFAGQIFIAFRRVSSSEEYRLRLTSELDLGAVGPCAGCEASQKIFHTGDEAGWERQLINSFSGNYSTEMEKGFVSAGAFELNGHLGLQAGTVHIKGKTGLMARAGRMRSYFAKPSASEQFEFWFFVRSEVQAVAFNGTLQGPLFNKGNYYYITSENVTRTVFRTDGGLALSYKSMQLEYRHAWITREFGGGLPHGWGSCSVSWMF